MPMKPREAAPLEFKPAGKPGGARANYHHVHYAEVVIGRSHIHYDRAQ